MVQGEAPLNGTLLAFKNQANTFGRMVEKIQTVLWR